MAGTSDTARSVGRAGTFVTLLLIAACIAMYILGRRDGAKTYRDEHPCSVPGVVQTTTPPSNKR